MSMVDWKYCSCFRWLDPRAHLPATNFLKSGLAFLSNSTIPRQDLFHRAPQAESVKNNFLSKSRKSESSVQNGTDLRPDSGSAASNGSICDWSIVRSDRQSGALSAPAGAAYLVAGMVRCGSPITPPHAL